MNSYKRITGSIVISILVGVGFSTLGTSASNAKVDSTLPANIQKSGQIIVGIDATYAPNEYKDKNGKPIGWEVDLFNAVAVKLGVKVKYVISNFDNILPAVIGKKYDVGVSSFTDNATREKSVHFVNYYNAGIQWATRKGKVVDPNNACGLTVAVQTGTTEQTDLSDPKVGKSIKCVQAKKKPIKVLNYDAQDAATSALLLGRVDAFSADSPVTQYGVAQFKDKLTLTGSIYDAALYGYAVAKGSTLPKALSGALTKVYKDGTYKKILSKWGVEAGAISTFSINGATK